MLLFTFLISVMLVACNDDSDAGGSSNESGNESDTETNDNNSEEPYEISIVTNSYTPEPPTPESPAWQAIEDFTNTKLDITYVPSSNYEERFNITLASGDLPSMILTNKTSSFINAVQDGAFWDLTDHLADYENLSQLNDIVKNNISIDGSVYGLYRARPLGRMAVTIRKDWLDNLGMEIPTTTDEFYDVMYAFTHDDPDGNGQNDTVGTIVSEYPGPWDIMQTWFGVPNKWGD